MAERDAASTVYVGNGVAVPHGTKASAVHIRRTGLAVVQAPGGVDFGKDRVARLLVAVAALGDEHMDLLAEIAELCADDDALARLLAARTPEELHALLAVKA